VEWSYLELKQRFRKFTRKFLRHKSRRWNKTRKRYLRHTNRPNRTYWKPNSRQRFFHKN